MIPHDCLAAMPSTMEKYRAAYVEEKLCVLEAQRQCLQEQKAAFFNFAMAGVQSEGTVEQLAKKGKAVQDHGLPSPPTFRV